MMTLAKGAAPTVGICILLIAASLILTTVGMKLPLGAALFPVSILGAISLLSGVLIIQSCLRRHATEAAFDQIKKVVLGMFCVLIYLLGVATMGFYASTFLMIPLMSATFGYRRWLHSVLGSALFTVMLYLLFDFAMGRSLPNGWLM